METAMRGIIFLALAAILVSGCWTREKTKAEEVAELRRSSAEAMERSAATDARATDAKREQAKDVAVAQASANLGPVADAVEAKGETGIANVTRDQKLAIDKALDIPVSQYPPPTVTLQGLLRDAEAERAKAQQRAESLQGDLAKAKSAASEAEARRQAAEAEAEASRRLAEEERKKADAAATKAWWLQAGGVALGLLTGLGALAARLGLPGGQLASTLISFVSPMLQRNQKVADATIAAGDVGRSALSVLDTVVKANPELGGKLGEVIAKLTGGRANAIEDLFKLAAKSYVIDSANGHAVDVDNKLTQLRDEVIETRGGIPVALASVLKAL